MTAKIKNKKAKPLSLTNYNTNYKVYKSHDGTYGGLEKFSVRTVLSGFEIGCGVLICILPFAPCKWLGGMLISHGMCNMIDESVDNLSAEKNSGANNFKSKDYSHKRYNLSH